MLGVNNSSSHCWRLGGHWEARAVVSAGPTVIVGAGPERCSAGFAGVHLREFSATVRTKGSDDCMIKVPQHYCRAVTALRGTVGAN